MKLGKVLIVDDDDINRFISAAIINEHNCTDLLSVAEDGREAIEQVSRQTFDLILLDIHMPEMDGFEFLDSLDVLIQNTGVVPPTIVLLSGSSVDSMDRERAAQYSLVKGFLAKPICKEHINYLFNLSADR